MRTDGAWCSTRTLTACLSSMKGSAVTCAGPGYGTNIDEINVAAFLNERGQGQHELVQLLGTLFEDRKEAPKP